MTATAGNELFQIRVTAIVLRDGELLLVRQRVSEEREWSLPGGRLQAGETLATGVVREVLEETGFETEVDRLLYVCDRPDVDPPLLHVTVQLRPVGGELALPSNEFDANPISDVRFVPLDELESYGFSRRFFELARGGFPRAGSYVGPKSEIGL